MSTIIYLSNQQVQVVIGNQGSQKAAIKASYTVDAPEGSIINGLIMDPELFGGFIKDLWKQKKLPTKDVVIVINSTKFVGKTIEMPIVKDDKALDYIEREFTEIDRGEEKIYSFIPLINLDKNMRKVYAENISPDFLKDYLDIFENAGVKVRAIYSGESSIINLAAATVASKYKTFVFQIADQMTLATILWVDGSFYYYNSVRCFHEQGTEDFANDIGRSLSQIRQFMQAHQIEHSIEAIVMTGVLEADMDLYREAIMMQGIQEPVEMYNPGNKISIARGADYSSVLYATSGLFVSGKCQNFLMQYAIKQKREKKKGSSKSLYIIGGVLVVMLLTLLVTALMRNGKKKEYEALHEYNNSPSVMMDTATYDEYVNRNSFLYLQYEAVNGLSENLATYPFCNEKVVKVIRQCAFGYAEVRIDSFNADTGTVSMTATAENVDMINQFINRLTKQDIFSNIDYTGYTYQSMLEMWDIHVICTLSEDAGK